MNNNKTLIGVVLAALVIIIPLITTAQMQMVYAKPQPNIFNIGNAADAGKTAGIAAFKAGQSDSPNCSVGFVYCQIYDHEFHAGWRHAQEVAP